MSRREPLEDHFSTDDERFLVAMAREGRLDVDFDADAPPPPGLDWQSDGERWTATMPITRPVSIAVGAGLCFVGFVVMMAGLFLANNWIIAIGLLAGLFGLAAIARPFIAQKQLTVTHDQAVAATVVHGVPLYRRAIPLEAIIRIYTTDHFGPALVLETPETRLRIAELPADHAQWLAPFALAAIGHFART